MPLHKKRGPVHEINVVPYVDVMLVLLVIFMVTAPLITPAVIDLPTVDKASAPRVVPLEVFVRADQGLVVRQRDARASAVAAWQARIAGKIRSGIPESALEGIPGNPAAVFDVVQLPTGEVLSVKMRKSSGYRRYDEAVERAILKA